MGFIAKAKTNTTTATTTHNNHNNSSESRGMGFLLVLFPADNNHNNNNNNNFTSLSSQNRRSGGFIKRTNSSSLILTKTQSTISICALLVFVTLLLFTLSTFEPKQALYHPNKLPTKAHLRTRHNSWFFKSLSENPKQSNPQKSSLSSSMALQRLGTLFRRGTRAMSDLVLCHVTEDVAEDELMLFLRVLHRSGLTARADLVFIFGSPLSLSRFGSIIGTENESFLKLVHYYKEKNVNNNTNTANQKSFLVFDLAQFMKPGKKEVAEPLWGRRIKANVSDSVEYEGETKSTRVSYGSVVGFEANELDPENSLAGFLDHVPMSLRRWACYPMLLGRVRRNFKHVMLVDVKNSVVLGDPLGRVRNRSPESVYVATKQESKHHKRHSDKTQSHCLVNTAVLMGGARGIRRLSHAVLYEIVRAAMQHKRKNSVTESGILSQLVGNEHLLKNINLIKSSESVPDTSSLSGLTALMDHSIIQRGNSNSNYNDVNSIIMKQICSCEVDSSVYRDC